MSPRKSQESTNRRATAQLEARLESNLLTYAAAASATGVAVLALGQSSQGKIVYTPAHIRINHSTVLDLNHDGSNDFTFTGFHTSHRAARGIHNTYFNSTNAALSILGAGSANHVLGGPSYASALKAGLTIGSSGNFAAKKIVRAHDINGSSFLNGGYGPWAGSNGLGIQNRYLGLKFTINGQTHFGWARLNVKIAPDAFIQATITGYAYEDVANKSIQAGKTMGTTAVSAPDKPSPPSATLGLLAGGAPTLSLWRRKKEETRG